MRPGQRTTLLLALLLGLSACAPICAAVRVPGDLTSHLLMSSGLYLLSEQSSRVTEPTVDLGLSAAQLADPNPLTNPAVRSVFARDSVVGRRAAYTDTPQQKDAAFDPRLAAQLAQLQSISYCGSLADVTAWNCSRCGAVPGFQPLLVHFDESWDLLGYIGYWPARNAKVLVFRGTDSSSWYNWAENMRAWRTDAAYPVPGAPQALRIHSGFLILWNSSSLAATFHEAFGRLRAAHPTGPTFVLGHSMGGALAQLAALDLQINYSLQDVRIYSFGSPRVGNAVFSGFLLQHVSESWRFTHGRDIVPSVPPLLMGFHHASREVWLVDVPAAPAPPPAPGDSGGGGGSRGVEERVVVCDDSGEDPTCHNSACRLGLCTSVADHLEYLGAHMYRGGEC